MAKEIDIRITATPHDGSEPIVTVVRGAFPDAAHERGRVASEYVWLHYPDAGFVGYMHGEARFLHPTYDIVAAMVWDSQSSAAPRSKVSSPIEVAPLF